MPNKQNKPNKNTRTDAFKRVCRKTTRKHRESININQNELIDLNKNSETVRKTRDKNSRNVKIFLTKAKAFTKKVRKNSTGQISSDSLFEIVNEALTIIREAKTQIVTLQEKNSSLSSEVNDKIEKIKTLYHNNNILWRDITSSICDFYEDDDVEDDNKESTGNDNNSKSTNTNTRNTKNKQMNRPKTLEQCSTIYSIFNFPNRELIQ